ncbi:SUKH-3 domain-containing protein [Streptomyces afghaniensis]|uniref:SUKH-3 domain-containing protein n=1 Tax=Streptomyces afghaniensis TaxID=66865 RepID=UPI0037877A58
MLLRAGSSPNSGGLVTYGWPADTITTSSASRFDPLKAGWRDERFAGTSRGAGASLYPVGTADEGASFLGITEHGALHLVRDRVDLLAETTDRALDRLVEVQAARQDRATGLQGRGRLYGSDFAGRSFARTACRPYG